MLFKILRAIAMFVTHERTDGQDRKIILPGTVRAANALGAGIKSTAATVSEHIRSMRFIKV